MKYIFTLEVVFADRVRYCEQRAKCREVSKVLDARGPVDDVAHGRAGLRGSYGRRAVTSSVSLYQVSLCNVIDVIDVCVFKSTLKIGPKKLL